MNELILLIPLVLMLLGASIAALFGWSALNLRLKIQHLSWILAGLPSLAFIILAGLQSSLAAEGGLRFRIDWVPELGLGLGLYFDQLSALFALLVTGIGALVVIYTGSYFRNDSSAWRFLSYLFLFMFAMLGLVLAGDLISLFVFWEITSVTSYLLVAYKTRDAEARRGAFHALLITAGGGVALLIGFLVIGSVAGSFELVDVLGSGDSLRASNLYLLMLVLVALGALTKSAQFPFHFWLPGAMSAPTPASAYLHSATMVKAGIYLLARLNPALGFTEAWFWLLTISGLITMLLGAYLGLKQNDLKALLAYSTITQLGVLIMLVGQDTSVAFKALVIGILAHALYKSALFLAVGIVDIDTGTRDLRRLGGLWLVMPAVFVVATVAALSMAGLPPLFGFLAKETLLATTIHPSIPPLIDVLLTAGAVLAGALLLAQAGKLVWDTFLGAPRSEYPLRITTPRWLPIVPAVPAFLSLALGLLPEPQAVAQLLAGAAEAAFGKEVKVSLALWTGLNVPLLLSVIAITLGVLSFIYRTRIQAFQVRFAPPIGGQLILDQLLAWIDRLGTLSTRLQEGRLRTYLAIILAAVGVLIARYGMLRWPGLPTLADLPDLSFDGELAVLRVFSLFVTVGAALATVLIRRDLSAILAFAVSGFSLALWLVLEPAPDVALVLIVVDILTMVVLVLALTRLPRRERLQAWALTFRQGPASLIRDVVLAGGSALVVFLVTIQGLISRPRVSQVTPFYQENAKLLTGAIDVVGAIIVDFRALDTLVEISVVAVAGMAVYTLLRIIPRKKDRRGGPAAIAILDSHVLGIGGRETSPFIHLLAYVSLPIALLVAVIHLLYGHDQPGDGFTAGVIVSLSVAFWYVVFGPKETRGRLTWLRPFPLVAAGITLAIVTGVLSALLRGSPLSHIDFGRELGLRLMSGFNLSTAFFFELAIGLTVLGSLALILDAFGRPPREMESAPEARLELASSGQPDPVNVPMKGGAAVAAAGRKPPAEDATG